MKRSKIFVISFFVLGALFLICALPAADWFLAVFYEFEPNFRDVRFQDTVKAMHICGCVCFLGGMLVYVAGKLKKEAICSALAVMVSCSLIVILVVLPQRQSVTADIQDMDVSSAMTFEELVSRYAESADIPYEKALKYFPAQSWKAGAVYRTLSVAIEVSESYHPTLEFYCETQEGASSWGITSIHAIQLNRKDGSTSMQFSGEIQTWLRGAYKIEYVVNGDFYKNGTTTVGGSVGESGGIGDLVQISYQTSFSVFSNHYAYCYVHDTKAFQ